jgi:acyl-CoA synthetase (AMP-forming)/AMP-acid ligase II
MQETESPATVPALLAKWAATRAEHDAIATVAETLTYRELDRRTARMARALLALGAGKGCRIALLAPGGVLWLTAFLASLRIGALVSLVSTLCTARELAHILRNGDAQILIGVRGFLRHDYVKTLLSALPELSDAKAEALRLKEAPFLRSVWLDDAAGLTWAKPIAQLLQRADAPDAPDVPLLRAVEQQVVPSDDALIVYTSGSTSQPKAVVHSQWNATVFPLALTKYFLLKPEDRMMPHLPTFWLGGLGMTMQVLSIGATIVYPPSPEIDAVLDTVEQCRVNRINSWGDVMLKLRDAAVARGIEVDKIVGLGAFRDKSGTLIPQNLQSSMLGMSETFTAHSAEPLDVRLPEAKAGASGRAVGGFERRLIHPETGEEVRVGEVGELQLRGSALMSGLYKTDRSKVFTADGFYATGDLARMDEDGYLYFVGRRGDMIKSKAANVSRLEVEAAMRELPEVDVPVVVGLPDPVLGQRVVAAVVPVKGAQVTQESLRAKLREALSSYKIPRDIVFIAHDEIPRTMTGKIRLPEMAQLIATRIEESHR